MYKERKMKKIIAITILATISLSSFAAVTFSVKIPQPDFISNDWDGDNIPNIDDTDDDNDGVDDVNDSTPFGGKSGGSKATQSLELSEKYIVSQENINSTFFGYIKDTSGSITNEIYESSSIQEIRLGKMSGVCNLDLNLKNGDYTSAVGIKINEHIFDTSRLAQFNLATTNQYNTFNFKTEESFCDDMLAESQWNIQFIKKIPSRTEMLASTANLSISLPKKEYVAYNENNYSLHGYLSPTFQNPIPGYGDYTVIENVNGEIEVNGINLEIEAIARTNQPQSSGYGSVILFKCNPLFDGKAQQMLTSIKDNDGNIIRELYLSSGYSDVSIVSSEHQSIGVDYCMTKSVKTSIFFKNTYDNKTPTVYYWF
jgi:hypothetical protein